MDAEAERFVEALEEGDDASALSLLENGRVKPSSLILANFATFSLSLPVILPALQLEREHVVRALVSRGASLDDFLAFTDDSAVTMPGFAIYRGSVPMLSLCHELGAGMSTVYRTNSQFEMSAVNAAISFCKPGCLAYLLDTVIPTRPVSLDDLAMTALSLLPTRLRDTSPDAPNLSDTKAIFRALQRRGFDFKLLEELGCTSRARARGSDEDAELSMADVLLTSVQASGDASFLRFVVKNLGLVSTAGQVEAATDFWDDAEKRHARKPFAPPSGATLAKYECAACESACATKVCGGYKVARYCTTECQTWHWRTGGHKKECKEIQRRVNAKLPGAAGSSQL